MGATSAIAIIAIANLRTTIVVSINKWRESILLGERRCGFIDTQEEDRHTYTYPQVHIYTYTFKLTIHIRVYRCCPEIHPCPYIHKFRIYMYTLFTRTQFSSYISIYIYIL